jgi:hypothetical protein
VLVFQFRGASPQPDTIPFSRLVDDIESGQVIRLLIDEGEVEVIYWNGSSAVSRIDPKRVILDQLEDFGISPEELSSDSIQLEYVKIGSSIKNMLIGIVMGGLIGILVGASLMRMYIEFRPKDPT